MNGRGLRLYGLSSFTRPVSYPCHRPKAGPCGAE